MKKEFMVEGQGRFPEDMLRYDCCEFLSDFDKHVANDSTERRRVQLVLTSSHVQEPTKLRWASFGWYVIEGQ